MRYRALSSEGDYRFGAGSADFLSDVEAVAQAVRTRLLLFQGEWWEDISIGLPFWQGIAGQNMNTETKRAVDMLVQDRILGTEGVSGIVRFQSEFTEDRRYTVRVTLQTIYGTAEVEVSG